MRHPRSPRLNPQSHHRSSQQTIIYRRSVWILYMGGYHSRQDHLPSTDQCTSEPNNGNKSEVSLGMSGHDSSLSVDSWVTYSQYLHSSQCTHITLVSKGPHISRRDEAFVCVFLHIIGSYRDLRVWPGCVEDGHLECPQNKKLHSRPNRSRGFKKLTQRYRSQYGRSLHRQSATQCALKGYKRNEKKREKEKQNQSSTSQPNMWEHKPKQEGPRRIQDESTLMAPGVKRLQGASVVSRWEQGMARKIPSRTMWKVTDEMFGARACVAMG